MKRNRSIDANGRQINVCIKKINMTKKEQKDLDKLKSMYALRDEMAKGGKRSCPYCKSRSWWQTATQGRQCEKCYRTF